MPLESPLPASLRAGRATALFLYGSGAPPATLRPAARGIGERGVWWTTERVRAHAAGATVDLHGLAVLPVAPAPAPVAADAPLAICMATYDPDPELLAVQVASLQAQTVTDWVCVVADDGSPDPSVIERAIAGDERFVLLPGDGVRRGFYRNFERALDHVPVAAELVALCDQDDRWHPEKLATLRDALAGGAVLAFSDQRLTDPGGRVLRDTLWHGRAVNHDDLLSMLVANSVTGAATLFRRDLLDVLLPFPDTPGLQFHDHWLGVAALATGRIAYVDAPLYDYVQHPGAVFGDVTGGGRRRAGRRSRRAAYFLGYLAREVQAQTLLARGAEHPVLRRFAAAQRSPAALAWLARAPRRAATLGAERELVAGVLWRWAAATPAVRDASIPGPLAFEQRALRQWRARLT